MDEDRNSLGYPIEDQDRVNRINASFQSWLEDHPGGRMVITDTPERVDTVISDQINQLTVDNPVPDHRSEDGTVGGAEEVMPWWPTTQLGDNEFIEIDEAMPWWPIRQEGDDELLVRMPRQEVPDPGTMARFPPVAEAELQDPICPCCYVAYGTPAAEGEVAEHAVRTPCNHVFGNQCLETWLPNNSCPLCRRELFPARRNRLPSISHLTDDAALPPLVIRVQNGVYFLDGEPISMATVRGFRDLARERAANPQSRERRIIFETDDAYPSSPGAEFAPDDRLFLLEEVRTMVAHREYRLYQRLQAEHVVLPRPRWTGPPLLDTLDWRQHRELFREIQRRGAFRYPGMRQYYSNDHGNVMRDAVMFQELREAGACWHTDNSWSLQDSRSLWNEDNDGMNQSGYSIRGWDNETRSEDLVQPMVRANDEASFNGLARSIDTWVF